MTKDHTDIRLLQRALPVKATFNGRFIALEIIVGKKQPGFNRLQGSNKANNKPVLLRLDGFNLWTFTASNVAVTSNFTSNTAVSSCSQASAVSNRTSVSLEIGVRLPRVGPYQRRAGGGPCTPAC